MTMTEKINYLREQGAEFFPPDNWSIDILNAGLSGMGLSQVPENLMMFYKNLGGGLLGDAIIFPVNDMKRKSFEIPGLLNINKKFSNFKQLAGKMIFGRNRLYIFTADLTGAAYIHDVLTLQALKKYDDLGAAMTDCLMVGKI